MPWGNDISPMNVIKMPRIKNIKFAARSDETKFRLFVTSFDKLDCFGVGESKDYKFLE